MGGPPRRRAIPHLSPPRPPSCAHNRVCAAAAKGLGVERAHLLRWGAALSGCRGSVRCRRGRGRGGLLLSNTAGGWRGAWGGTCRGKGWVAESPPLMVGGGSGRVSWQPVLTFTPSIAAAASKEVGSWQRSVPRGAWAYDGMLGAFQHSPSHNIPSMLAETGVSWDSSEQRMAYSRGGIIDSPGQESNQGPTCPLSRLSA